MNRTLRLMLCLAICCALLPGALAAQGQPDQDRFIVTFENPGQGQATLAGAGAERLKDLPEINAAAARVPAAALDRLRNNPNVKAIDVDHPVYPMAQTVPYGIGQSQADIVSEGPGNRTVCIIDSGYDLGHEDLPSNVSGYTAGNLPPFQDGFGHGTHVAGTIAGLDNSLGVVGVVPGIDLYIVRVFGDNGAWAYSSDLIDAAFRCRDGGANVISMSLGCSGNFCRSTSEENAFNQLWSEGLISVAAAGNDGNTQSSYPASYDSVISVAAIDSAKAIATFSQQNSQVELAAAGVTVKSTLPMGAGSNESASVDGAGYEVVGLEGSPTATGTGSLVDCGLGTSACPGGGGQVCLIERGDISFAEKVQACEAGGGVGAIVYNNIPGLFSGTLSGTVTGIPSVSMSQVDGQSLDGSGASTATVTTGPGNYAFWDGTSMATPHVSGVAALVWSHDTSWTNQEIRDALTSTAEDLGSAGRDNAFGFGLIQADAALQCLLSGSCGGTEPPVCSPAGASCTAGADCCSGSCKGKPGGKTCK